MLDTRQIEEIERAMLEEHKRDLDALTRLKRFLPGAASASPKPNGRSEDSHLHPRSEALQSVLPTNGTSPTLAPVPSIAGDTDEEAPVTSLRRRVGELMASDHNRGWTGQKMLAVLRDEGVTTRAKKPINVVVTSMAYWVKRDFAYISRRGAGRMPNIIKWRQGKELPNIGDNTSSEESDM